MNRSDKIERLLETRHWVVDILPMQVPADGSGQYFEVEQYYLQEPRRSELCARFVNLLIKLTCYYDIEVNVPLADDWNLNPKPKHLAQRVSECMGKNQPLLVLIDQTDTLMTLNWDTYMTVYNPPPEVLGLVRSLAAAEGFFVWQPQ